MPSMEQSFKSQPMGVNVMQMMQMKMFTCKGMPNVVGPFYKAQLDAIAASWTFCKKQAKDTEKKMFQQLEQNVKTAKTEKDKAMAKWALDTAKGGNFQVFSYLSPAPESALFMMYAAPYMKSEEGERAMVVMQTMDPKAMMAGVTMPSGVDMSAQMRPQMEKMCN